MNILLMCVANSARSQLGEGLAKEILGSSHHIESAGSFPSYVNPHAVQALKEIGIDISKNTSKTVSQLPQDFIDNLDYVITLCAEEVCPAIITRAKKIHWPMPDPTGHQIDSLPRFRIVRDEIRKKLLTFAEELKKNS